MKMEIDKSFILWALAGIVTLVIVAVKATVHKIIAPLKLRQDEQDKKMLLLEEDSKKRDEQNKTIIDLLEKIQLTQESIPGEIDRKIIAREQDRKAMREEIKKELDQ